MGEALTWVAAASVAVLGWAGAARAEEGPPAPSPQAPSAAMIAVAPAPVAEALAEPAAAPGTLNAQFAALRAAPAALTVAPPAAAPSVTVAREVVDAAGAFEGYMHRTAAVLPRFANGEAVGKALQVGSSYSAAQLSQGAIAYGALIALQDPAFVEGVREGAGDPDALAATLTDTPAAALRLPAAPEAAARIQALVGRQGAGLSLAGEAVRQAAYAVQRESWSRAPVEHAADRLAAAKAAGGVAQVLSASDQATMMTELVALRSGPAGAAVSAAPTPAVARSLALAALAVVGRADEAHAETARQLLADARGLDCLKMAKLNLYQCLAVAGPHYEDMFCLGRHAMADTGQCVTASVGWSGPLEAAPVLTAAAAQAPAPVSVEVPVAVAALDGPERRAAFAQAAPPAVAPPPVAAPVAPAEVARPDLPAFQDVARVAPGAPSSGYAATDGYGDEDAPAPRRYARREAPLGYDRDPARTGYGRDGYGPDGYAAPRDPSDDDGYDDAPRRRAPREDGGRPGGYDPRYDPRYDDGYTDPGAGGR